VVVTSAAVVVIGAADVVVGRMGVVFADDDMVSDTRLLWRRALLRRKYGGEAMG
jgi:hypothetical protein